MPQVSHHESYLFRLHFNDVLKGSAVCIGPNAILTARHLVTCGSDTLDARLYELKSPFLSQGVFIDHIHLHPNPSVDLALLMTSDAIPPEISSLSFLYELQASSLANRKEGISVLLRGYPLKDGGEVARRSLTLYGQTSLETSGQETLLTLKPGADEGFSGSAGIITHDDKIYGVGIAYLGSDKASVTALEGVGRIRPLLERANVELESFPAKTIFGVADAQKQNFFERNPNLSYEHSVFVDHLPKTRKNLFGRDGELKQLSNAWFSPQTRLISVIAFGGFGKSALVKEWMSRIQLQQDYLGADRVFAWSFYNQGTSEKNVSADLFFEKALRWFGDPNPNQGSSQTKGERLASYVLANKTLLILDGLEPHQHPPGEEEGKIKNQSLRALLQGLVTGRGEGLCVITSRLELTQFGYLEGKSVVKIQLTKMNPEAACALLRDTGVKGKDDELNIAAKEFEYHALALVLLGTYVDLAFNGYLKYQHKVDRLEYGNDPGKHARKVMSWYETWFSEREALKPALEVLYMMGLFDRPADEEAMEALRLRPPIKGLTDRISCITETKWNAILVMLRRQGLLSESMDSLDAHPLIREYFGKRLKEEQSEAYLLGHRRLFNHYSETAEEFPEDVPGMESLYCAVNHGCEAHLYRDVFEQIIKRRIWRKDFYATRRLGMMGADFVALAQFFDVQWRALHGHLGYKNEIQILTDTGIRLRALARIHEAMECFEEVVCRSEVSQSDFRTAAQAACQVSELLLICGRIQKAKKRAEDAIRFATQGKHPYFRMHAYSTLADVYLQLGSDGAGRCFQEAINIERVEKPNLPFMYSQSCYRYCSYLLDQGEYEQVIAIANREQDWGVRTGRSLLSRAIDHVSYGRALMDKELALGTIPSEDTLKIIATAITQFKESGYIDYLVRGRLIEARAQYQANKYDVALRCLDEAKYEADMGNMKLLLADVDVEKLLLAYHRRGEVPIEEYERVETNLSKMCYKRGLNQLARIRINIHDTCN